MPRASRCIPLILALAVLGLAGCEITFQGGGPTVKGSGVAKTESRKVDKFSKLDVSGAVKVEAKIGKETAVEVTVDDNLLEHLITEVKGDTLHVYMKGNVSTQTKTVVKVTTPQLVDVNGNGATRTVVSGVKADKFKLDLSGASRCTLTGTVKELVVDCSGASQAHAAALETEVARANASGASQINVKATKELNADASGASQIVYDGSPNVKAKATGASSVKPK